MIHICFSGNDRMFTGLLMSISSILVTTKEPLSIYLFTGDFTQINEKYKPITPEMCDYLDRLVKLYNEHNSVKLVDFSSQIDDFLNSVNKKSKFTIYTLLRLYIDLAPIELPDKLLYLDIDTMVYQDINQLYSIDLNESGHAIAAVVDAVGRKWINKDYCNAGVLLLNVTNILKGGKFKTCREMCKKKFMFMPDQTAINRTFRKEILRIDKRFNEQQFMKKDTVVRHYCNIFKLFPYIHFIKSKPWSELSIFHKERNEHQFDDVILYSYKLKEMYENAEEPIHFSAFKAN